MKNQITIISSNLWYLPWPVSRYRGERLTNFQKIIHKCQPDFICLQEVFTMTSVKKIKQLFPQYHAYAPGKRLYNPGGLLTLSRSKISNPYFEPFYKKYHTPKSERLGKKGFLITEHTINNQRVSLINTHFYNWTRQKELHIVIDLLAAVLKVMESKKNVILAGDFNLYFPIVKKLLQKHPHIKLYSKEIISVTDDNPYEHCLCNRFTTQKEARKSAKGIDYVLVKLDKPSIKLKLESIEKPLVSNHYPILGEISF